MAKERVERDEEDLVRLYLTDIGQYPLLTKEGEVRLAQEIEAGLRHAASWPNQSRLLRAVANSADFRARARPQLVLSSSQTCVWLFRLPRSIRPPGCRCLI